MNYDPLVSVIIPTFNSERFLEGCLRSVMTQSYSNIEVIVVDNYSVDKTREIAENFGAQVVLCRSSRARARNIGVDFAQGAFILSLDSDMELTPKVVKGCLEAIKNKKRIGGIIIPEVSVGNSFWVKVRNFERNFYANTAVESARFFRKDLVEKANGFDEDLVCFEESTLPQKLEFLGFNVKIRVCAEIIHHEDDFSLWKWLQKKFYYGKTARVYKIRYKEYAAKQMNVSNRFLLLIKDKRFYSKPLQAVGVIVLKTLEHFSMSFGILVGGAR